MCRRDGEWRRVIQESPSPLASALYLGLIPRRDWRMEEGDTVVSFASNIYFIPGSNPQKGLESGGG
jgi:hypothetical protein